MPKKSLAFLGMLVILSSLFVSQASFAQVSNGCAIQYSAYAYKEYLSGGPSFIGYSQTLFAQQVTFNGATGEEYITSGALGGCGNPAQSFGLSTVGGNVTISGISGIILQDSTQAGKIQNITLYNVLPTSVQVGPTLLKSSTFITSYPTWKSSAAPAVFYNSSGGYVEISSQNSPLITIDPPSVICLSPISSSIDVAFELFSVICIVLASVFILKALGAFNVQNPLKKKTVLSLGSMDTRLELDMTGSNNMGAGGLVLLIIVLVVSSFIALYFSGILQGLLGC